MRDRVPCLSLALVFAATAVATAAPAPDPKSEAWARRTLKRMTLERESRPARRPGALHGVYTPHRQRRRREARAARATSAGSGGFHVFGGGEALPPVLLEPRLRRVRGPGHEGRPAGDRRPPQPAPARLRAAAALHRRLRGRRRLHRRGGDAPAPRDGPRGDAATRASPSAPGGSGAGEGRALGVHVDFYPVVDVNNNPMNPIINIRSFGEDPAFVARMAVAYMQGIQRGRHARDGQALPRPRRHRDRHPPRPRGDRAPARPGSTRWSSSPFRPRSRPGSTR